MKVWSRHHRRIGTGWGDAIRVRILENVFLCTIQEVVEIVVEWRSIRSFKHIVSFRLEPIEWLLRSVCAVPRAGLGLSIGRIGATATRELRCGECDIRGGPCHVAPEAIHVVLLATAIR